MCFCKIIYLVFKGKTVNLQLFTKEFMVNGIYFIGKQTVENQKQIVIIIHEKYITSKQTKNRISSFLFSFVFSCFGYFV